MNDGIRGLPTQLAQMPSALLGSPKPIPMPDQYWHPEAIDWAMRASANGGTISTTTIRAVSEFCRAVDTSGIRSAMYRVNMFCGGNLSGCLVPLYRGPTFGGTNFGNATDTNVNFVSGDFVETGSGGGLKGNGTNKYLNTGLATSSLSSNFSLHHSFSGTSIETSGSAILLGMVNTGNFQLRAFVSPFGRISQIGSNGNVSPAIASPASSESHVIGNRRSATDAKIFSSGTVVGTNATSAVSASDTVPIFVFATNNAGSPASYTSARARMYSVGLGLTDTQAAAFSTAVAAFNSSLAR